MFFYTPLFLFIISLIFMYLTPVHYTFYSSLNIAILMLVLSILIAVSSLWIFKLKHANISPINIDQTTQLIKEGIYRYTRNPMYLSLLLALIAYFFYLGNLYAIWGIIFYYFTTTHFQIKKEEQFLLKKFGSKYQNYIDKVHRWI